VYQVEIQNMDHLKERIRNVCARIPLDMSSEVAMSGEGASVRSLYSACFVNKNTIFPTYGDF
jgi:hypothetical protein